MRPFISALLLVVALTAAGEPKLSAPMHFVQLSPKSLPRICPRAGHRFAGCTRFVDWKLSAQCVGAGNLWSMNVEARYDAFVYFVDGATIGHELLHVRDVETGVTTHIRKLAKSTFTTGTACRDAAGAAEGDFHGTLRELARRSQAQRD